MTELTQSSEKNQGRKSPLSRGNFSQPGKQFDQNFYFQSTTYISPVKKVELEVPAKKSPRVSTTAFTSVSRETRPNMRFSQAFPRGEFNANPDYEYGRSRSPTWSFPRRQRYASNKIQEYQICKKHPFAKKQNAEKHYLSTSSMKETEQGKANTMKKSTSFVETAAHSRNYSIVLPRKTSAVELFTKTKIRNPFYLTKQQVMNQQQSNQLAKVIGPRPKGYIQFYKKRPRQPITNMKGFQACLQSYRHQKQFNNFSMEQYPNHPTHHIDFDQHLDRDLEPRHTYGPNLQPVNIDAARVNKRNINLAMSKFIQKIRTRYDRAEPEPNTRIDYDPPQQELGGMVPMKKVIGRNKELFPIVDPAIKKAGDDEMRLALKAQIPVKEINEAMRPQTIQKI